MITEVCLARKPLIIATIRCRTQLSTVFQLVKVVNAAVSHLNADTTVRDVQYHNVVISEQGIITVIAQNKHIPLSIPPVRNRSIFSSAVARPNTRARVDSTIIILVLSDEL